MKSFFIPTSSQNFNNIFSTESISPAEYYAVREFGYKRFKRVEPNPLKGKLLLYNSIPFYTIPISDYDDYPMIVEVDRDLLDDNYLTRIVSNEVDIFSYEKTIYLHPQKTKIHFFQANHLKTTMIASERSIEIKLYDLYKTKINVVSKKDTFNWNPKMLPSEIDDKVQENEVAFDQKLNNIKGLYYGYLVGVVLSRKSQTHEFEALNSKFHQLTSLLKKTGAAHNKEAHMLWDNIRQETEKQLNRKEFSPTQLSISNSKLTALVDDSYHRNGAEVFRHIANMLLEQHLKDEEEFKTSKVDIAFSIGSILKEHLANWDGSNEQAYMNGLLDNIEKYEPFDIKSHSSSLIQSISAFILKGEDPDKLLKFLAENKIYNLRIALGFWGASFGFASLPKTFFKNLFSSENKIMAIQAYCHFFLQVHGLKVEPWKWESMNATMIPSSPKQTEQKAIEKSPKKTVEPFKERKQEKPGTLMQENPKCPKCGSDMILRDGKYGKFYGCSKYSYTKDSCDGKLPYPFISTKKQKTPIKEGNKKTDILGDAIIEYVQRNGQSKISDLIPYIKEKTNITYQVGSIASYIKDFLSHQLKVITVDRAKTVKLKDKEIFDNQ